MRAALRLPVEKRNLLLQRLPTEWSCRTATTQSGLDNAVRIPVRELVQEFSRRPGTILWLDREVRRVRQR
jgi:hypothetical protein